MNPNYHLCRKGQKVSVSMEGIELGVFDLAELDAAVLQARTDGEEDRQFVLEKATRFLIEERSFREIVERSVGVL